MQSSPPTRDGKARTLRELSRSLSHSPRQIPSPSPPPSDSNPTKRSGFDTATSNFFNDPDVLMSTQHKMDDDTNVLPQYPRIRSTAKKVNAWHMLRSEQPIPDTSMVDKEFRDFDDQSLSADDDVSIEQARGVNRSSHDTPIRASSQFNSLYDITPPSNRTRKSHAPETGSLRRDAQIRRASRNDLDTASPRPASKRNSPAVVEHQERRHASLAQFHAKLSEDESSFMDQRPPTLTIDSAKNTRWGNRSRQVSGQGDQTTENIPSIQPKSFSRPGTAHNATAQSFILPDLPNLTELVSGVFEDGTPVISKTAPARSRFAAPPGGGRRPQHIPIEGVPIPEEEKVIFAALQQLQDKVAQMEQERAIAEKTIEDQDMELIELRATNRAQEKLRRSDSAHDSETGTAGWKVEKTRLDATVQTLRTKLDRTERKVAVLEIEKKRLTTERDNMAKQLSVAFQTCEELKREKNSSRDERDVLHTENETLRNKLDHERSLHREETVQLQRQFDQATGATEKENVTLHAELARKETELLTARQAQAEFDRLKRDHEHLKSQLASLKAKREEDIKNWARQEAALTAQVSHRDETIQYVERRSQQDTNEAMRQDIDHLRDELSILSRKHHDEHQQWIRKEADMKRRIRNRENTDIPGVSGNDSQFRTPEDLVSNDKFTSANGTGQRRSSYRRDDTRSRIHSRVQQEIHNSRAVPSVPSMTRYEEDSQKSSVPIGRSSMYGSQAPRPHRNFSAPIATSKTVEVESEIESTTDLSLAPRSSQHVSQTPASDKAFAAIPHPAELDLTELSFIDGAQIARLRRALEEERIAARNRPLHGTSESQQLEETAHSQRPITREDTSRSIASMKSSGRAIPRKSSLKDNTQRTNITQFEEDATGNTSNFDAADETTQDKQVAGDISKLSNTGRRRRSAPTEMTSAFIVPDIKLENRKETVTATNLTHTALVKDHDNNNCTVCRREGLSKATEDLRVPKLIPVSSRMPDDIDATLRPTRSPREALALVVKELKDERAHLHMELAVMRAMLESHDVSLGNRKRNEINASIRDLLRRLDIKDTQIYNLYDVLEGQQDAELTELDVENITEQIRAEEEKGPKESAKKGKKVTIRSFVDDDSVEIGRGTSVNLDEDTEELPWEGFEDSGLDGDARLGISAGWSVSLH